METWKLWGIIIEPSGNQPQWGDSRDILGSLWPHYPGVKTKWATHGHPKWKSPRNGRYMYTYIYIYQYLVGGLEHVLFFHILGISSSQLTKSIIFQRGRSTTNQICMVSFCSPEVGNPSQGTNRCASASRIERGLAHAGARPLLPVSTRQLNFGCLFQVVF